MKAARARSRPVFPSSSFGPPGRAHWIGRLAKAITLLMPSIEFHAPADIFNLIPHPYPASRAVPEWLKHLPMDHQGVPTLKRCAPFLQAITAGYIIPIPYDIHFELTAAGELKILTAGTGISGQLPSQQAGTPFAQERVIKIVSPWIVKTPPGYSALFTPLFNRYESPLIPMAGIVETDNYYLPVH